MSRRSKWRVLATLVAAAPAACHKEAPPPAAAASLATLDSAAEAGLAVRYAARTWLASLPGGTVARKLDADEMMRAFARRDSAPVVFGGTVTAILARAGGKVVVLEPDYHDADTIADFEVWASCSDSLAALAAHQETMARREVAVVSRVESVQRLVWSLDEYSNGARDRYYVAGSCLALVPLPQSAE